MTNVGNGPSYDVTVNGASGRAELRKLTQAVKRFGDQAVSSGKDVDRSVQGQAQAYAGLARSISTAAAAEEALDAAQSRSAREGYRAAEARGVVGPNINRAQSNAAAAQERLVTQEIKSQNELRQQANRDLIASSQVAINRERELEAADRRRYSAQKTAYSEQKRVQSEMDRAFKARDAEENRARRDAARVNREMDAAYAQRTKQAAAELAIEKQITKETQDRIYASYMADQRAANNRKAVARQSEDAIYEDLMRGQRAFDSENSIGNINATRYALYDVASTAAIAGTAVVALGAYSVYTATQFETSFGTVRRALQDTENETQALRQSLIDVTMAMPASFAEVTEVATLGAQMGIADSSLDSFTKTVIQFSSATNASIDTTAQSFGRMANLLDVPTSKFENLSSAIFQVGVESVATETEILSVTQQISGAAAAYGFLAQDVVGISAAFASLAIAPEAARGSVTRIFGDIEKAVAKGGDAVAEYARLMGMGVDATARLWEEDPTEFFTQLIKGLSQSNSLIQDLSAIGANDVRDVNLLQRLAGNPELLVQSIASANSAFDDGTATAEAYAITMEQLGAKLQVLFNSFQAFAAGGGAAVATVLKPVVELLTALFQLLAGNPVLSTTLVTISLLVGGFLLMKAATAAAMAGLMAMLTVIRGLGTQSQITGVNMASLLALMRQIRVEAGLGAMSVNGLSGAARNAGSAIATIGKGVAGFAAVTAVLWLLDGAVNAVADSYASAGVKAEKYFGDVSGFSEAVSADIAAYEATGEAISVKTISMEKEVDAAANAARAAQIYTGAQSEAANAVRTTTEAVTEQTVAFGANAEAWLREALAGQQGIKDLANNPELVAAFEQMGGSFDELIRRGLSGTGSEYVTEILQPVYDELARLEAEMANAAGGTVDITPAMREQYNVLTELEGSLGAAANATDNLVGAELEAERASALMGAGVADAGEEISEATTKTQELKDGIEAMFSGLNVDSAFFSAMDKLYGGLVENGNAFNAFSAGGQANLQNLQGAVAATADYAMTNGMNVNDALISMFGQLQQQGVDVTSLLHSLTNSPIVFQAGIDISAIQSAMGSLGMGIGAMNPQQKVMNDLMTAQASSAKKAANATKSYGKSAGGAAKEVRTLSDYVSDLSSVLDKAFEIRYGAMQAEDNISSIWNDMAKEQADAARERQEAWDALREAQDEATQSIKEYRAELEEIAADKMKLEFQLSVAEEYGNTIRIQEIRAELAELEADASKSRKGIADANADVADAQRELQNATGVVDRSLQGNSEAAIKNRADLLDLVGGYNDYITQLANSGLSTDELRRRTEQVRQEFINQATQLGYNRQDVMRYAASFGDVTTAINKVPRNITVSGNNDPALRAIDEMRSRYNAQKSGIESNPVRLGAYMDDSAMQKFARGQNLLAMIKDMQGRLKGDGRPSDDGLKRSIQDFTNRLNSGNYHEGGVVPGTKPLNRRVDNVTGYLPDGTTVGLQGGEGILNNRATSFYGKDMIDGMNALAYKPFASTMGGGGGGSVGVSEVLAHLSPEDRAILRALGDVTTILQIGTAELARANRVGEKQLQKQGEQ